MSIQKLYKFWLTTSLAFTSFYCLVGTGLAQAQSITPDATLPTPTEVTPTEDGVEITGGTARDINLFHSFQEFSLLNGNEAFFNNASTISNIITRVTGGEISTIDGLIRANNANLFFLNPAGILFGPNASLNIGGSFYGSTADSLIFPEGEFSATNPQAPPILTINAPIGLGFRDNPGDINVNGSVLSVDAEKTLALIGGDVTGDFGYLIARGGRIELGGLTATGTVSFNDDGSLSFPDAVPRGNVSLIDQTWLEVDGKQGGSIAINANNLDILENSKLQGGTFSSVGLANSQSGDIILNATGDITVDSSRIDNAVGIGNAGNTEIIGQSFSLNNGGVLTNSTFGEGNAGNITLNIDGAVDINNSEINSNLESGATGNAGDIEITSESLSIQNAGFLENSSYAEGNAGNVTLNINNAVNINDGNIFNNVEAGAEGNGGTVTINSGSLSLQDGGQIQALVRGEDTEAQLPGGVGSAGNIVIDVEDSVNIAGISGRTELFSAIFSFLGNGAKGSAGNINITAGSLVLDDGGFLQNSTFGEGRAGDITLDIDGAVTLSNDGDIFSEVRTGAILPQDEVSKIIINADSLSIADEASSISTNTFGTGNAGNITLNVSDNISLNGGDIFSQVGDGGKGNAGNIEVNTTNLSLLNGSQLTAGVFGTGDAGKVIINATDTVSFQGVGSDGLPSGVINNVAATGVGNAGDIEITTKNLTLNDNARISSILFGKGNSGNITLNLDSLSIADEASSISTNTFSTGRAGNITLNVSDNISLNGGDIFSQVGDGGKGNGGNIEVNTTNLSLLNGSQLSAGVFGTGDAGKVIINATDTVSFQGVGSDGLPSGVLNNVAATGVGNAGDIEITTRNLTLNDKAIISSNLEGIGNAGNININTQSFSSSASIVSSSVLQNASGQGGKVTITTDSLNLSKGSFISTGTFGKVGENGRSNAGSIEINLTDSLEATDGSFLFSVTFGEGDAGDISINGKGATISFDGIGNNKVPSSIFTSVGPVAVGQAGNIFITAKSFDLTNGAQINSSTLGQGSAGKIDIDVDKTINIDDGKIFSTVEFGAIGNGGEINIITSNLNLINGGTLTVSSFGQGNGGNIFVQADSLTLNNGGIFAGNQPSKLLATNQEQPVGGNITLEIADNLILKNDSTISASAGENANGGNIDINAEFVIAFPSNGNDTGNDIIATAQQGRGGNIDISTQQIFNLEEQDAVDENNNIIANGTNDIDASSDLGIDGQINIRTFTEDVIRGASELPRNPIEPEQTVAQACSSQGIAEGGNSFTITGKGGVPPQPTEPMSSEVILSEGTVEAEVQGSRGAGENLSTDSSHNQNQQPQGILTSQGYIVPAQGIVKKENGEVMLVGYPVNNINQRTPVQSPNCGKS
ncbi:filamentous haemagglutinin outer membrane protein [Stanieria sp. NIES-3757]|nr:filamentous haemagglutinin outer membrane protein [Stanieria sp. NIES-3757]